jgi:hypothetical protein
MTFSVSYGAEVVSDAAATTVRRAAAWGAFLPPTHAACVRFSTRREDELDANALVATNVQDARHANVLHIFPAREV